MFSFKFNLKVYSKAGYDSRLFVFYEQTDSATGLKSSVVQTGYIRSLQGIL